MSDYKNSYNKTHYDRINLMIPAGKKEEVQKYATTHNMSVNAFIWTAIAKELHSAEALRTINISNRRYVGSKKGLLPFIRTALKHITIHKFADLFAGTGVVAGAYNSKNKTVITNDILYSNYICHQAWFSDEPYNEQKIREILTEYNALVIDEENYATKNYADLYFSYENASKIGHIRESIEQLKRNGKINQREYSLLIMSLLYATQTADVSRTVGHYMTYIKKPKTDGKLQLRLPLAPSPATNRGNKCYNIDALELIKTLPPVDVIYIDPPYTRQYSEYYHVLESIALWNYAPTFGKTRRINTPKSDFSIKTKAVHAFSELVYQCKNKTRYILVSDNTDPRNHLKNIDIMETLSQHGKTRVFTQDYPAFHGAKTNLQNRERLFLCKVND